MPTITEGLRVGLVGKLGDEVGGALLSVLDTLGGDGSGQFSTVVVQGEVDAAAVEASSFYKTGTSTSFELDMSGFQLNAPKFASAFPASAQTIANSGEISLPPGGINKVVDNAGAVTGIILNAGTDDGQIIHITNLGSGTVTFAASGTSRVASGTSAVIAVNTHKTFIWRTASALWFCN